MLIYNKIKMRYNNFKIFLMAVIASSSTIDTRAAKKKNLAPIRYVILNRLPISQIPRYVYVSRPVIKSKLRAVAVRRVPVIASKIPKTTTSTSSVANTITGDNNTLTVNLQHITNPAGVKGDTGAQGPKGDKGETGQNGLDGINGLNGEAGATGAQGPKGDTGAQGPVGPAGPAGRPGISIVDGWAVDNGWLNNSGSGIGGGGGIGEGGYSENNWGLGSGNLGLDPDCEW